MESNRALNTQCLGIYKAGHIIGAQKTLLGRKRRKKGKRGGGKKTGREGIRESNELQRVSKKA